MARKLWLWSGKLSATVFVGRARSSLAVTGALLLSASVSAASGDAVTVAGQAVHELAVRQAVALCELGDPKEELLDCIRTYWVPRWLMDAHSEHKKLTATAGMQHRFADLLHVALIRTWAKKIAAPSAQQIDDYLTRHPRDFEKPLRLRLLRILLSTEQDAQEVLQHFSQGVTMAEFRKVARDKSLDRATHERGGDLGFVWPDGTTDVPQVSAEKVLYQAALPIPDSTLVPEPVREGKRFAVVFRAMSLPPKELDADARAIASLRVVEEQTEKIVKQFLSASTETHVRGRRDVLLGKLRRKDARLFVEP